MASGEVTGLCPACYADLEGGQCPHGHPQTQEELLKLADLAMVELIVSAADVLRCSHQEDWTYLVQSMDRIATARKRAVQLYQTYKPELRIYA